MKENELRVGNIVHNGVVREQEIYDSSYIELAQFYEPIPLTEEWLLRLGFHKISFRNNHNRYDMDNLRYNDGIIQLKHRKISFSLASCKYVHQLQNLYFALKGTELTLTDKAE